MNRIQTWAFVAIVLSSKVFAYAWTSSADAENPCANPSLRSNYASVYQCLRTDTTIQTWEPAWVCFALPKGDKLQSIQLNTKTSKFFYEDTLDLKLSVPAKESSKTVSVSVRGNAKDRQSFWDQLKVNFDKRTLKLSYRDTTALPYAPSIKKGYDFHFDCNAPLDLNGPPVPAELQNLESEIASSQD